MIDYFTSPEQEQAFKIRYQKRWEQEQDLLWMNRHRNHNPHPVQEEDRVFFVEPDGFVYLGEVKPENLCPCHLVVGGKSYGIDPMFLREAHRFIARHDRYMVVFQMRKGYHSRAGIYPTRMVSENEEIVLEEQEQEPT